MELLDYIIEDGLIMIPFLYVLGSMIKNTNTIKDKFIPLVLLALSLVFTPLLIGNFTIENIVQAVLIAGITVYSDQLIKQLNKKE